MDIFPSVGISHNFCAMWSLSICLKRISGTHFVSYLGIYFIIRLLQLLVILTLSWNLTLGIVYSLAISQL